jgi:hypothetical protein
MYSDCSILFREYALGKRRYNRAPAASRLVRHVFLVFFAVGNGTAGLHRAVPGAKAVASLDHPP